MQHSTWWETTFSDSKSGERRRGKRPATLEMKKLLSVPQDKSRHLPVTPKIKKTPYRDRKTNKQATLDVDRQATQNNFQIKQRWTKEKAGNPGNGNKDDKAQLTTDDVSRHLVAAVTRYFQPLVWLQGETTAAADSVRKTELTRRRPCGDLRQQVHTDRRRPFSPDLSHQLPTENQVQANINKPSWDGWQWSLKQAQLRWLTMIS